MTKKLTEEKRKNLSLIAALLVLIAGSMALEKTILSQSLISFIFALFVTSVAYIYIIQNFKVSK